MPLVRIDLNKSAPPELARAIGDAVYTAMVEIANVPPNDKFQIVTRHDDSELVYPAEGYLGVQYSRNIVFIQVTWVAGRATEVKKAFYKRIADDIEAKTGLAKSDILHQPC